MVVRSVRAPAARLAVGAAALLLTSICLLLATPRAHAAPGTVARVPVAAAATLDPDLVQRTVCASLGKGVSVTVNYVINVMSRGRIKGTLAGSILSSVGFKPWCRGQYGKLRARLQIVEARRPALRSRLGPFVFGAGASAVPSRLYANSSFFTVRWSEFPRSTVLDTYYLWYSINGGAYRQHLGSRSIHLRHGYRVRFATRIVNILGSSSPWAYTPEYFT